MATERDARDLARGIARVDWLQFSSEKQKHKKSTREKEKTHTPPVPRRRTPHHHQLTYPHTHTHSYTHTHNPQRKNPNLHYYRLALLPHPKIHDITTPIPHFPFLLPPLSTQEAQNFVSALRAGIPAFLYLFLCSKVLFAFVEVRACAVVVAVVHLSLH